MEHTILECLNTIDCCAEAKYSCCGNFLAFSSHNKVTVVPTSSGVFYEFVGNGRVDGLDWCKDSDHILYVVTETKTANAHSLSNRKWRCTIYGGKEGLLSAVWSPSGKHILTTSEFNLRITIWSMTGGAAIYFENTRIVDHSILHFSPSGAFFTLPALNGRTTKIFSTVTWKKTSFVGYEEYLDSTPLWSPTNDIYVVFNSLDMKATTVVVVDGRNGKQVGKFERENRGGIMGVKSVNWSHSGQLLAVADCNDCIYLVEILSWSLIAKFSHTKIIFDTNVKVQQMAEDTFKSLKYKPISFTSTDKVIEQNVWRGARKTSFNVETTYMATIASSMPAIVWVWSLSELKLKDVIVLKNAVSELKWVEQSTLIICYGLSSVTLWNDKYCKVVKVPDLKKVDNEILDIVSCPQSQSTNKEMLFKTKSTIYRCKLNP